MGISLPLNSNPGFYSFRVLLATSLPIALLLASKKETNKQTKVLNATKLREFGILNETLISFNYSHKNDLTLT